LIFKYILPYLFAQGPNLKYECKSPLNGVQLRYKKNRFYRILSIIDGTPKNLIKMPSNWFKVMGLVCYWCG